MYKWKSQRQYRKLIRDFSKLYNTCWSHKESFNIGWGIWAQFRPRVMWGVKGGLKLERANVQKFKFQEWGEGECCLWSRISEKANPSGILENTMDCGKHPRILREWLPYSEKKKLGNGIPKTCYKNTVFWSLRLEGCAFHLQRLDFI